MMVVSTLLYSVCPVTLVVVLNSISAVGFLKRYFTKKNKLKSQRNVSGHQETVSEARGNKDTHSSAAMENDRKISAIMFLLSICFMVFVGSWYCFKYSLLLYTVYLFYAYGTSADWYLYKVFEVAELLGHLTTSFNGIVNSLIVLMFPITRKSLITGVRRMFAKVAK